MIPAPDLEPDPPRRFLAYEVPLKPNRPERESRARLVLPEDLTKAEADRLCAVLRALAVESSVIIAYRESEPA